MTDIQIEAPTVQVEPETEAKKPELSTETSSETVSEPKDTGKKRQKYDGRSKKRQWVFNRRNDDDAKRVRPTVPEDRVKRRKYLMVLGYAGANYIGMQRNPDVNTIEEELLKAMFKNKMITEDSFNQPQYAHFQRAARTDKGVSAARQVISLKLRKQMNFSQMNFSVKFFVNFVSAEQIDLEALNKSLPSDIKVFGVKRVTKGFNCKDQCNARTYSYTLPSVSFAPAGERNELTKYRIDDATLARVNETLKLFEGTKNFHNFTSRKKFEDPSARRFIIDFHCEQPFMVDDVEFCTIIVKGQSFMLHQIRKMIGLTIAVVRGITTVDTITKSFEKSRLDIPMAPGLGLVLDQVHYDGYNTKFKDDGMHEQLVWDDFEAQIQEFRDKFIYPVIKETELKKQPMLKWLETLPIHSYDEHVDGPDRHKGMTEQAGKNGDEVEAKGDAESDGPIEGDDDE